VLHAVLTQQLIPRRDNEGMALAMEMLMITSAIRNLIREGKTFQIQSLLQTGASSGMLTMEQSLKGLVDKRWISPDDALESCFDPKEMARLLGRK
jgi:twitching motility protein PilT